MSVAAANRPNSEFLESICEPLYDYLRPRIMHETQLVKLCELCSLLQSRFMKDPDDGIISMSPSLVDSANLTMFS